MESYPIKPKHIKIMNHFFNAFGNRETEISARYLVRMAQKNGDWRNFTKEEIDAFSEQDFYFNRLTDYGVYSSLIKINPDGSYSFTHRFIATCFLISHVNQDVFSAD